MPATVAPKRLEASPEGLGDVLEQLTTAHADLMERHGPLFGMEGVEPPTGAMTFASQQARLAAQQDAEADPSRRMNLMLERNAREHEQIGRLASFVAGYELAHGDPGNAPAMMELGGDHFDLAAQTRATLAECGGLAINQNQKPDGGRLNASDPMASFVSEETRAQVQADRDNTPTRPNGPQR